MAETVIWDPAEQLPREELLALQLSRLRATFGVDVGSLDDVRELPFSWKNDLREATRSGFPVPLSRSFACTRREHPATDRRRLHARNLRLAS